MAQGAGPSSEALLTVDHLSLSRGGRSIHRDLCLAFPAGICVILGPNGVGKTTFLEGALAAKSVTSGAVWLGGNHTQEPRGLQSFYSRIGYMPQDWVSLGSFTALESLEYAAWLKGSASREMRDKAMAALEWVQLSEWAHTKVRQLSGGMRRRLGLAEAFVNDPAVALLDEPTVGLDPEQRAAFRSFLRSRSTDRAILVSTHLIDDVAALADRVIVMTGSGIALDGSVADLERRGANHEGAASKLEAGYIAVVREAEKTRGVTGVRLAWLIARRSVVPIGAAAVAVVTIVMALATMTPGLRLWPDVVTGLSSASVYTGPIAAGFLAFDAGRWKIANERRARFGARLSALGRVLHASTLIAIVLARYLVALLALAVVALASGTYGEPSAGWLVAVGAALVLASSFGYVVGSRLGGSWFVPPVAALAFYAIYVGSRSAPLSFGTQALFPFVTNMDTIFARVVTPTVIGQTLLWIASAVLLLVIAGWGWRIRRRGLIAAVIVVALVVGSAGGGEVIARNGQYTIGRNPGNFVCESGAFTLCLNPGYAVALPALYKQFSILENRVRGTPVAITRLEQNVEGIGDDPGPGARSVYLEQFAGRADLESSAYRYLTKYGGVSACSTASDKPSSVNHLEAVTVVDAWLSGFSGAVDGASDKRSLQALRSMSVAQGNRWFRTHSKLYLTCELATDDLP